MVLRSITRENLKAPSVAMPTAKAKTVWARTTGQMEAVRQRRAPYVKPPQKVRAAGRTASGQGPTVADLPRTSRPASREVRITAVIGPLYTSARHRRPRKMISSPRVATSTERTVDARAAEPEVKTPPERVSAQTSRGKARSLIFCHRDGRVKPASSHQPVHASRARPSAVA